MTNWSKIGGINAIACKVSVATDRLRAGMTEPQPRTPKASNNSRPKMAVCLQADLSNMHVPKRCDRLAPVADVSVRLIPCV